MNKQNVALLLVATLVCSYGCKRDVMAPGPSVPVDGRQKFVGMYDVYDTIGNWLYEMAIIKHNENGTYDSLFINGWGGEFDFYIQHDKEDASNYLNHWRPVKSRIKSTGWEVQYHSVGVELSERLAGWAFSRRA